MTPNNLVKELMTCGLGPYPREAWFKKRQTTWSRRIEDVQHVVDLQGSRGSFSLDFGVFKTIGTILHYILIRQIKA